MDYELYDLGDLVLQHGATLRGAQLAYKTYGRLNTDKSNAIVYPTWYSGRHTDNEWLIGTDKALNPDEYFIIVPNILGIAVDVPHTRATTALEDRGHPLRVLVIGLRVGMAPTRDKLMQALLHRPRLSEMLPDPRHRNSPTPSRTTEER